MEEKALDLIRQNKLFDAIELLKGILSRRKDLNTLSNAESRLNQVTAQIHRGVLTQENANTELNQIRDALIDLVSPETSDEIGKRNNLLLIGGAVLGCGIILILALFLMQDNEPAVIACQQHKTALLVANFQDKDQENQRDEFATSIITSADELLENSIYDVGGIGQQLRERRYHESMRELHFNRINTCDTSGILVNGHLDVKNKVFNTWITLANLDMQVPELAGKSSLSLDNPVGLDFSIPEDAEFIAKFIYAILKSAEGKPYESLEQFFKLEQKNKDLIEGNPTLKANLAFFKGNAYAQRGDNERAKAQYDVAKSEGGPELKTAATANEKTSDRMNLEMLKNPETRKTVSENQRQHSTFEAELNKALKDIGRAIDGLFKKRN